MKDELEYLTIIEVLNIHKILIQKYGGTDGIRDMGALEAALFRPQTGYYEDFIEEAAALWESLFQNHPFLDGNKRVALAVVYTFLTLNGHKPRIDVKEAIEYINNLYNSGQFEFKNIEKWLRNIFAD
ncbi:MAG: type II toxin-antitoxin system death-on-curing family toxin [Candidatus Gastranaerophilales bacterium]|nr:type II toxin-antitoxin system death-on-curing family toxin [Candidatus Gastranaerophilales bacterium]